MLNVIKWLSPTISLVFLHVCKCINRQSIHFRFRSCILHSNDKDKMFLAAFKPCLNSAFLEAGNHPARIWWLSNIWFGLRMRNRRRRENIWVQLSFLLFLESWLSFHCLCGPRSEGHHQWLGRNPNSLGNLCSLEEVNNSHKIFRLHPSHVGQRDITDNKGSPTEK